MTGRSWPTCVLRSSPRRMSASLPIRDARYMTARQRTICFLAYIFFSVVLSEFLLQDSAYWMTASVSLADLHVRKAKSHNSANDQSFEGGHHYYQNLHILDLKACSQT
jgi:hypothetical protein